MQETVMSDLLSTENNFSPKLTVLANNIFANFSVNLNDYPENKTE